MNYGMYFSSELQKTAGSAFGDAMNIANRVQFLPFGGTRSAALAAISPRQLKNVQGVVTSADALKLMPKNFSFATYLPRHQGISIIPLSSIAPMLRP
jgi:hypothetical protein